MWVLVLQLSSYSSQSVLVPVAAHVWRMKYFSGEGAHLPSCQVSRFKGLEVSDGFIITLPFIFPSVFPPASDYGLFLSDEDPRKGIWLEAGRTLDYYMLRNGVCC
jgi:hypothetical protein